MLDHYLENNYKGMVSMKIYILLSAMALVLVGCYDDQALLNSPNIHPVENAEDKVIDKNIIPKEGYNRHNNGYYYYDNYYYHGGYYYCGSRNTRSSRACDDRLVGSNGPLTYQNSREGLEARIADSL